MSNIHRTGLNFNLKLKNMNESRLDMEFVIQYLTNTYSRILYAMK